MIVYFKNLKRSMSNYNINILLTIRSVTASVIVPNAVTVVARTFLLPKTNFESMQNIIKFNNFFNNIYHLNKIFEDNCFFTTFSVVQ